VRQRSDFAAVYRQGPAGVVGCIDTGDERLVVSGAGLER
jgi:hypothetical protein